MDEGIVLGASFTCRCLIQLGDGLLGIAVILLKQGDETAAENPGGGMGAGSVEGLLVADPEANHARIPQM
jgi:hypothetical protein